MTTNQALPTYAHEIKPLSVRQLTALMADLNPGRISNLKRGSGSLSYLEAWDVKATLIKVFGFGGFSAKAETKIERIFTGEEVGANSKWTVLASAHVELYIHQLGAVYTEGAVSSQAGSQVGEVADFAVKTAESDALKRAAIYLGTQFGLSLYNNGSTQDIIRVVLAQGAEWPAMNPDQKAQAALAAAREIEYIQAIVDGVDPATAKEQIWGAPQAQPQGQAQPVQQQQVQQGPPPGSNLSPEAYAEAQALVQRGLTMRAQQAQPADARTQPESAQGVDFAKLAEQEQGTSAVLEPDYSAEAEAYAAADGHHE
jgi:recombination DNA repair RAD52 pathway protein